MCMQFFLQIKKSRKETMNNPQYFNSCVFVCVFLPNICDLKAAQWYNSRSLVWLAKGWDKIKTKDDNDNDSGNNKAIICWSWSCQWSLANTFWGIWIDCWSNNSKSLIFTFFFVHIPLQQTHQRISIYICIST